MLPRNLHVLGIDIVHGCQLRCLGCPNSALRPAVRHTSPADFAACLGNVDVSAIKNLRLFNFGEPLLHPDVPGILKVIPTQRFAVRNVEISTNAQAHDFAMLTEVFKTGVLDTLVVSCDGDGTPAEYERLRPPARWDRLLEFLAKARELRDHWCQKTRLRTRTICETDEGRQRWTEVLLPLGFTPEFRGWLSLPGAAENPSGRTTRADGLCVYMQRPKLYVDYDGTVVPCCIHPQAATLGNLKESRYSEILRGQPRRRFLRELRRNRPGMAICGKCEIAGHRHRLRGLFERPLKAVLGTFGR